MSRKKREATLTKENARVILESVLSAFQALAQAIPYFSDFMAAERSRSGDAARIEEADGAEEAGTKAEEKKQDTSSEAIV